MDKSCGLLESGIHLKECTFWAKVHTNYELLPHTVKAINRQACFVDSAREKPLQLVKTLKTFCIFGHGQLPCPCMELSLSLTTLCSVVAACLATRWCGNAPSTYSIRSRWDGRPFSCFSSRWSQGLPQSYISSFGRGCSDKWSWGRGCQSLI